MVQAGHISESVMSVNAQEQDLASLTARASHSENYEAITPHIYTLGVPPRRSTSTTVTVVGQPLGAARNTYKSCEFCAKRKRRCDGDGVNRCRLVL